MTRRIKAIGVLAVILLAGCLSPNDGTDQITQAEPYEAIIELNGPAIIWRVEEGPIWIHYEWHTPRSECRYEPGLDYMAWDSDGLAIHGRVASNANRPGKVELPLGNESHYLFAWQTRGCLTVGNISGPVDGHNYFRNGFVPFLRQTVQVEIPPGETLVEQEWSPHEGIIEFSGFRMSMRSQPLVVKNLSFMGPDGDTIAWYATSSRSPLLGLLNEEGRQRLLPNLQFEPYLVRFEIEEPQQVAMTASIEIGLKSIPVESACDRGFQWSVCSEDG